MSTPTRTPEELAEWSAMAEASEWRKKAIAADSLTNWLWLWLGVFWR